MRAIASMRKRKSRLSREFLPIVRGLLFDPRVSPCGERVSRSAMQRRTGPRWAGLSLRLSCASSPLSLPFHLLTATTTVGHHRHHHRRSARQGREHLLLRRSRASLDPSPRRVGPPKHTVEQKTASNLPASHTFQLPTILLLAPPPPPLSLTSWNARFPYFCSSNSGRAQVYTHLYTQVYVHEYSWLLTRCGRCRIRSCDAAHRGPLEALHT